MTEPNLNSQIVDIINNFLQDNKLVDARTCEGEFLGMHSSLTVGGAHEVVEELEKLISDQVAKAMIDELEHLFDRADGERSARRYTAILEQRIKVLRTRLKGDNK